MITSLLKSDWRGRMVLVLAAAFLSTLAIYALAYAVFEPMAAGVAVAWGVSILILFHYLTRKRSELLGLENRDGELRAFINLQSLSGEPFLPYTFWTMAPSNMLSLVSAIQYNGYRTIVECGAGVSTIMIANLLRQQGGGHLYSLEEDPNWHQVVSAALVRDDLADYVTLIHAPLERHNGSGELWYCSEATKTIAERVDHIDLLLVDGPKSVGALSRYPALPEFIQLLNADSLVILDDSNRKNEQAVISKWKHAYPLTVDELKTSIQGQAYIRLQKT